MEPSTTAGHDDERWYALYLRSRYEKRTNEELMRKQIQSFLPLVEEVHLWSDRKKKVLEPLFRCYIFVRANLRNRVDILQTEGVIRFVGIHNRPSPIPDEQINWIRIVLGCPEAIRREAYISIGEKVRVIAGPFSGIQGIVTRVKGSTRVIIALESIAQAVSVEVPPEYIERLEDVVGEVV